MNEENEDLTGKCDQLTQPEELEVLSKYLKAGREQRDEHITLNQDNLELSGRKTLRPLDSLPTEQIKLTGPKEINDLTDYLDTLHDDKEVELPEWLDTLVDNREIKLDDSVDGLKVNDAIKELPKQIDSLTVSEDIKLETKLESLKGANQSVEKLESPKEMLTVNSDQELEDKMIKLSGVGDVELSTEQIKLNGPSDIENLNQTTDKLVGPEDVELKEDKIKLNGIQEVDDLRQKEEDKLNTTLPSIYSVRDLKDLDQYYNNILNYADKFSQSYPDASGLTSKIGSLISAYLSGSELTEDKKEKFEDALFQALLPVLKSSSDWEQLRLKNIKEASLESETEVLPGTIEQVDSLNSSTQNIPSPTNNGFLDTGTWKNGKWAGITKKTSDDLSELSESTEILPAPTNEGYLDTGTQKDGSWVGITKTEEDDLQSLSTDTEKIITNHNDTALNDDNMVLHDWASSIGGGSNEVFASSFSDTSNTNTLPPYQLADYFDFWKDGKLNTNGLNINDYLRWTAENTVGLIPRSSTRAQRQARALALDEALALLVIARDELEKVSKARRWRLPGEDIMGLSSLVSDGVLSSAKNLISTGIKDAAAKDGIDFTSPQNRPGSEKSGKIWTPLSNKREGVYYNLSEDEFNEKQNNLALKQKELNGIKDKKAEVEGNVNTLQGIVNDSTEELNTAKKDLGFINSEISVLESGKSKLSTLISEIEGKIDEAKTNLSICEDNIKEAETAYNTAKSERESQETAVINAKIVDDEKEEVFRTNRSALDEWKTEHPGENPETEWEGWSSYQESLNNASSSSTKLSQEKDILDTKKSTETEKKDILDNLNDEKEDLKESIEENTNKKELYEEQDRKADELLEKKATEKTAAENDVNSKEDKLKTDETALNNEQGALDQLKKDETTAQKELDDLENEGSVQESSTEYTFTDHYLQGTGIKLTLMELCGKDPSDIQSVDDLKKAIATSPYMFSPEKITSTDQDNSVVSTLDVNNSWEIIFEPYYGNDNGNTSFLPHIEEINYINQKEHGIKTRYSKYLPISSFDINKEAYTSREIALFSGSFAVPDIMTYQNDIRISFVDDQYKSLRRYFELCARVSTFESNPHILANKKVITLVNKNRRWVAPYRNVTFRCLIYSMTPQKSTVTKYDLLLVMTGMIESRSGDISATGGDLTIAFSVVGENPEDELNTSEIASLSKAAENNYYGANNKTAKWKQERFKSQKVTALNNLANSGLSIIT